MMTTGVRVNTTQRKGCLACGRPILITQFYCDDSCRRDSEWFDRNVASNDECEFEQRQPHEWYCVTHDVTKIAGTTEPIKCDWWQELFEGGQE